MIRLTHDHLVQWHKFLFCKWEILSRSTQWQSLRASCIKTFPHHSWLFSKTLAIYALLCYDDKVWMEEGSMVCLLSIFQADLTWDVIFYQRKNYLNTWAVYDIHPLPDPCSVRLWRLTYSFSVIKRKERINWLIQEDFKYCFLHIYLEAPGISTIIYALAGSIWVFLIIT